MLLGPTVLLVLAVLMLLGGMMGRRAGSRASVIAGSASATMLLVAWGLTFVSVPIGLGLGAFVTASLCVVFGKRVAATGKFMPAGMLLGLCLTALVLVVYALVA